MKKTVLINKKQQNKQKINEIDPLTIALGGAFVGTLLGRLGKKKHTIYQIHGDNNVVVSPDLEYSPTKLSLVGADSILQYLGMFLAGKLSSPAVKEKVSSFFEKMESKIDPQQLEQIKQQSMSALQAGILKNKEGQDIQVSEKLLDNPAIEGEVVHAFEQLSQVVEEPSKLKNDQQKIAGYIESVSTSLGDKIVANVSSVPDSSQPSESPQVSEPVSSAQPVQIKEMKDIYKNWRSYLNENLDDKTTVTGVLKFKKSYIDSKSEMNSPFVSDSLTGKDIKVYVVGDNPYENETLKTLDGQLVSLNGIIKNNTLRVDKKDIAVSK